MKKKFLISIFLIILSVISIVLVLASENALIIHPKGMIARQELELIIINIFLMLLIILPTYFLLFGVVWRYCIKKKDIEYDPNHTYGWLGQLIMWALPIMIVIPLAIVTWGATHQLNPYRPIETDTPPLVVEVVALDWKWLFIYPELGIAALNNMHIPERTPIHLKLTADGSPMNSFWVPQLSGQIYSMTGMTTQLYLMADAAGEYPGRAVEINGEGYADMTFLVKSTSRKDFDEWAMEVKKSMHHLTEGAYRELVTPSINKNIILFSEVEEGLYRKIVDKYKYPAESVL